MSYLKYLAQKFTCKIALFMHFRKITYTYANWTIVSTINTVLLLYYYAKDFELKGIKGLMITFLSLMGLFYVWLDKCTLQYSVNADYPNTLTDLLIPAYRDYNFNLNNIMTKYFYTDPKTAAFYWLIIFFVACILPIYSGFFKKEAQRKTQ